jgi:hypothetical protein
MRLPWRGAPGYQHLRLLRKCYWAGKRNGAVLHLITGIDLSN